MSNSDRNGDITRGLILGFLAGVLFMVVSIGLSSPPVDVATQAISDCSTGTDNCTNNGEGVPDRWYWLRRLFAFEDTLAQWVMMAFTIAAAGLLMLTLKVTQNMANDTREMGNRQIRAYCGVDSTDFVAGHPDSGGHGTSILYAEIIVKNYGATPAYKAHGWAACGSYSKSQRKLRGIRKGEIRSKMPLGPSTTFRLMTPIRVVNEASLPDEQIFVFGYWRYEDCFGERRSVRFRYCIDSEQSVLIPAQKGNYCT